MTLELAVELVLEVLDEVEVSEVKLGDELVLVAALGIPGICGRVVHTITTAATVSTATPPRIYISLWFII